MKTEQWQIRGLGCVNNTHRPGLAFRFLLRWWPAMTIAGFAILMLGLWLNELGDDVALERLLYPWPIVCIVLGCLVVFGSLVAMALASAHARSLNERLRSACDACVAQSDGSCTVCGFNFEAAYGSQAAQCIQVHLVLPHSELHLDSELDAAKHLVAVCPNCHAVIHSHDPPYTIEEVKALLGRGGEVVPQETPNKSLNPTGNRPAS